MKKEKFKKPPCCCNKKPVKGDYTFNTSTHFIHKATIMTEIIAAESVHLQVILCERCKKYPSRNKIGKHYICAECKKELITLSKEWAKHFLVN